MDESRYGWRIQESPLLNWHTQETLRELAPVIAILVAVVAILWYIFPYLPDHPPKKKK